MQKIGLALLGIWLAVGSAVAQTAPDPRTLSEIRAEIAILKDQIDALQDELVTADPAVTGVENPAPLLQRVDVMEQELRRITENIEELQFRVEQIVADGTNRIGDLEFRLHQLEGGNLGEVENTVPLGQGEGLATRPRPREGGTPAQPPLPDPIPQPVPDPAPQPAREAETAPPVEEPQLAISEQAAYDAALEAYGAGEHARAARAFSDFLTDYPGGPLAGEASFWRGEALAAQGDWTAAARSYLDSFSGAPQGPKAPQALYRLGSSLGRLGQIEEACLTLAEVAKRYPDIPAELARDAAEAQSDLGCF